jgi:hypothetical protein
VNALAQQGQNQQYYTASTVPSAQPVMVNAYGQPSQSGQPTQPMAQPYPAQLVAPPIVSVSQQVRGIACALLSNGEKLTCEKATARMLTLLRADACFLFCFAVPRARAPATDERTGRPLRTAYRCFRKIMAWRRKTHTLTARRTTPPLPAKSRLHRCQLLRTKPSRRRWR